MLPVQEPYREYAPAGVLRRFVECYWTSVVSAGRESVAQRVLPDGCIDIIFDLTRPGRGAAEFVGTMTRPLMFDSSGGSHMVAVRFRPGAAVPFLGFDVHEITDRQVEMSTHWQGTVDLADQLREQINTRRQVRWLESALLKRLVDVPELDRRVQGAVELLQQQCSVKVAAEATGLSRQHLARLFRQHVGIGPKMFQRVVRMRRLASRLKGASQVSWPLAALEAGYCDQAHMIGECRSLTGLRPTELALR